MEEICLFIQSKYALYIKNVLAFALTYISRHVYTQSSHVHCSVVCMYMCAGCLILCVIVRAISPCFYVKYQKPSKDF